MSSRLFTAFICLISLVVLLIVNAFVTTRAELGAVAGAWGMAMVHVLAGFFMSRWALGKSVRQFMTIVMGGIGVRLLMVGVAMLILMPVIRGSLEVFVGTFAVFYVLFQIVEIFFLHRGLQRRKMIRTGELS